MVRVGVGEADDVFAPQEHDNACAKQLKAYRSAHVCVAVGARCGCEVVGVRRCLHMRQHAVV